MAGAPLLCGCGDPVEVGERVCDTCKYREASQLQYVLTADAQPPSSWDTIAEDEAEFLR